MILGWLLGFLVCEVMGFSGNIGSMPGRGKTGEKGRGNCATTSRFVLNLGLWGFEVMMAFLNKKI